ncbi:hypothetical protein J2798_004427 [Herbaspirillum seropedicae]|nr:hypothetical protein [Herbaspirillum seropedicae]
MVKRYLPILLLLLCVFYQVVAEAQTGTCPRSAVYYQGQYDARKNVDDLVCLQTATRRELQLASDGVAAPQGPAAEPSTKPSRPLTRVETWCADQVHQSFEGCVKRQSAAEAQIERFLALDKGTSYRNHEARSACRFYSSGGKGTGSMGLEDLEPIASCIKFQPEHASAIFQECVAMVTGDTSGQPGVAAIAPNKVQRSTERIRMCFLSKLP